MYFVKLFRVICIFFVFSGITYKSNTLRLEAIIFLFLSFISPRNGYKISKSIWLFFDNVLYFLELVICILNNLHPIKVKILIFPINKKKALLFKI